MEATTGTDTRGILSEANAAQREEIVEMLQRAYWMEIETVMSYLANSVNPDGVRAQEIKESLAEDIQEELGHAQRFAERIKELWGVVPGSEEFQPEQSYPQPPEQQTDIVHVIQDMVTEILHDEEGHRRLFEGFLREYQAEGLA